MTSYDVKSGDKSTLAVRINSTQTTGIQIAAMNINGSSLAWGNQAGVFEIMEEVEGIQKREWVSYTGGSTDSSNVFTPSGVSRDVARDASSTTGSGTGQSFNKGASVRFVDFHYLWNLKANTDRANTYSANQTIASGTKILFGGSSAYVYSSDSGTNLKFKDASNSETTLTQIAALTGTDTKARITTNDTTSGFLQDKLPAGNGITMTLGNAAANETLTPAVSLATDPGLEFSSSALRVKIKASGGVTRDSNGLSIDTSTIASPPTGGLMAWSTRTAPTGWLLCNGAAASRSTYATLFSTISPTIGTVTVTIASPAVFSFTSHGLLLEDAVYFTTTGALPTGLTANTLYYVISAGLTANAFEVSATRNGSAVNTSGTQSGVHTLVSCPFGLGDGSTTFNVPDLRGRTPRGDDKMGTTAASRITSTNPNLGVPVGTADGAHTHTIAGLEANSISGGGGSSQAFIADGTYITDSGTVMTPGLTMFYIIKT